jgi:hypothetical protein
LHEWGKVALDPDRPDAYFIPSSKKASPSAGAAIADEVRLAAPISEAENESTFAHRVTDARNLPATVACRRGYTPFT